MRGGSSRISSVYIQPLDASLENVLNPASVVGAHDAARFFVSADFPVTPSSGENFLLVFYGFRPKFTHFDVFLGFCDDFPTSVIIGILCRYLPLLSYQPLKILEKCSQFLGWAQHKQSHFDDFFPPLK